MRASQYSANINVMVTAAEKAARSLVRDFGEVEQLQISKKGPADFVSAADIRAEEIIQENLSKARPDFGFLMEESGKIEGKTGCDSRWIIDPLDGTMNFLHGIPYWCISIGLEEKGEIIAGVVYNPVNDELFWAEKGRGSFMNNRRLRVSGRNDLNNAVVAMNIPTLGHEEETYQKCKAQMDIVMRSCMTVRSFGAAALDLSYVAYGRLDCFWQKGLKPWDVSAASIIIKEAGGSIKDMDGKDNYIYGSSIIAGNAQIVREIQTAIGKFF